MEREQRTKDSDCDGKDNSDGGSDSRGNVRDTDTGIGLVGSNNSTKSKESNLAVTLL